METDFDIIALAGRIREVYISVRQESQGTYNGGKPDDPTYIKAAHKCKKLKALPEDYVRAQRYFCKQPCFFLSLLASKFAEKNYQKYMEMVVGNAQARVLDCVTTWVVQVCDLHIPPRTVVMDDNLDLFPWFRVIVASPEDYPAVREKYFHKAVRTFHPEYMKYLKDIPGLYLERLTCGSENGRESAVRQP